MLIDFNGSKEVEEEASAISCELFLSVDFFWIKDYFVKYCNTFNFFSFPVISVFGVSRVTTHFFIFFFFGEF